MSNISTKTVFLTNNKKWNCLPNIKFHLRNTILYFYLLNKKNLKKPQNIEIFRSTDKLSLCDWYEQCVPVLALRINKTLDSFIIFLC